MVIKNKFDVMAFEDVHHSEIPEETYKCEEETTFHLDQKHRAADWQPFHYGHGSKSPYVNRSSEQFRSKTLEL